MTDPQSLAYREAGPDDCWDGDMAALVADGATLHSGLADVAELVSRRDYELCGWDAGHVGSKTIGQARFALATRIIDPSAPDSESERDAYEVG